MYTFTCPLSPFDRSHFTVTSLFVSLECMCNLLVLSNFISDLKCFECLTKSYVVDLSYWHRKMREFFFLHKTIAQSKHCISLKRNSQNSSVFNPLLMTFNVISLSNKQTLLLVPPFCCPHSVEDWSVPLFSESSAMKIIR